MPITLPQVIDALDTQAVYLDEILSECAPSNAFPADRRWFARTLLDCLTADDLRAELEWRSGQTQRDPFAS
jgi:hypothetical protein